MSSTSKKQPNPKRPATVTKNGAAADREEHLRKLAEGVAEKHARTLDKLGR